MAECSLSYEMNVVGDCNQTGDGSIEIKIFGNKAPIDYTIKWLSPYNDVIELGLYNNTYIVDNLPHGYYSFYIVDTCEPVNNELLVTSYVSSGNCAEVSSIVHTTCGENNGEFEVTVNNSMDEATYTLFDGNDNVVEVREFSSNLSETFFSLSAGTYYATVDDGYGCTDSTFFSDIQNRYASTLYNSSLLLVRGLTRRTGERGISIRATGAWDLRAAYEKWREAAS